MRTDDTIAAVSSPPGRSPRAIVRLSGPATFAILATMLDSTVPAPRQLTRVHLRLPRADAARRCALPCLLATFRGPSSYTGQDLAEIQCPGHPALLERLLHQCVTAGVRLAEPGEFTFRAFASGKLDLTQAEGVAAAIAAESDSQLAAARRLRAGDPGRQAAAMLSDLADQLALVEAGIDFTDQEDVTPVDATALHRALRVIIDGLRDLLDGSRRWSQCEALPRVVLVGRPSAGKSTLFNALLGRERAVAAPMPGTTRDVLAEPLRLRLADGRSMEVMLIDIAGIDGNVPVALLDAEAQTAARRAVAEADVLLQLDDSAHLTSPRKVVLRVHAKADLLPHEDSDAAALRVSAVTGKGLDALRDSLARILLDRAGNLDADTLVLQPRHEQALRDALDSLDAALALLAQVDDVASPSQPELLAASMRTGLDALGALTGRMTPDDILSRVFAAFCIGK